jgi:type VI secretion system protein ImpM
VTVAAVGLLGKLPSHGDFLRRNVPAELAGPLDDWLVAVVAGSREILGEGWRDAWLEAPVWHFALAAGQFGPHAAAGVWLPSVDRVGRHFPLLLAQPLPAAVPPPALLRSTGAWYDGLEALALALLEGRVPATELDAALAAVEPLEPPAPPGPLPWRLPLRDDPAWPLAAAAPVGSLWWGQGSPRVAPSLLACPGLPTPASFAAMLDGGFAARGWTDLAA